MFVSVIQLLIRTLEAWNWGQDIETKAILDHKLYSVPVKQNTKSTCSQNFSLAYKLELKDAWLLV